MFVNPCHYLSWLLVPIFSCHHLPHRQIKFCIEVSVRCGSVGVASGSTSFVVAAGQACGRPLWHLSDIGGWFPHRRSQITHNHRCRRSPARNSKGEAATNRSHLRDQRYQHNHDATSKLAAAQQDEPRSKEHEILGSHYRLPLFRFSSTTARRSHHAVLHYPSSTPKPLCPTKEYILLPCRMSPCLCPFLCVGHCLPRDGSTNGHPFYHRKSSIPCLIFLCKIVLRKSCLHQARYEDRCHFHPDANNTARQTSSEVQPLDDSPTIVLISLLD